ncbi:hypothetical protein BDV95DRAFT_187651 [Massariosphaeria phaeospora]|uniref:Uncharacterized protein n=1 Tax=Massariosphaeria phaeospora TaxID=100035 RepID=A0A7C8M3E9_9PLEO|nr:hypothetical protein BDV95DRAFT_187651 [Massariosphaeria phaeospora]
MYRGCIRCQHWTEPRKHSMYVHCTCLVVSVPTQKPSLTTCSTIYYVICGFLLERAESAKHALCMDKLDFRSRTRGTSIYPSITHISPHPRIHSSHTYPHIPASSHPDTAAPPSYLKLLSFLIKLIPSSLVRSAVSLSLSWLVWLVGQSLASRNA